MRETGHTPGPWEVDEESPLYIRVPGGNDVAKVLTVSIANARLIAAAPDLLEALDRARQFIQNGIEFGYIRLPEYPQDPAHKTLPLILAALSKVSDPPRPDQPTKKEKENA